MVCTNLFSRGQGVVLGQSDGQRVMKTLMKHFCYFPLLTRRKGFNLNIIF
jgi:hypothetical protein